MRVRCFCHQQITSRLSRFAPARLSILAGKKAGLVQGFTLAYERRRGGLDPLLEFGHQLEAGPAGRYRLEEFKGDLAPPFDKTSTAPKKAGIDPGRNDWERERPVEGRDPGLLGTAFPRRDPPSFREDDE